MRKWILCLLAILLLVPSMAYAVELPGITISVTPVDYTYALANIAQPVSKSYSANERFALLVSIDVPSYVSSDGMTVAEPKLKNCVLDRFNLPMEDGDYLVFGTVLAPGASVTLTLKDTIPGQAATTEQLYYALYMDRTVSATAVLGGVVGSTVIPKTGAPLEMIPVALLLLGAVVLYRRRV